MYSLVKSVLFYKPSNKMKKIFLNSVAIGISEGITHTIINKSFRKEVENIKDKKNFYNDILKYMLYGAERKLFKELSFSIISKINIESNVKSSININKNLSISNIMSEALFEGMIYGGGKRIGIEIGTDIGEILNKKINNYKEKLTFLYKNNFNRDNNYFVNFLEKKNVFNYNVQNVK